MSGSLGAPFLCAIGIHKMPKWSDPLPGTKRSDIDPEPIPTMVQQRFCLECNKRKLRFAR